MKKLTFYLLLPLYFLHIQAYGDLLHVNSSGEIKNSFSSTNFINNISDNEILPPDEAFKIEARKLNANTLRVEWNIASGTYLYEDKIDIKLLSGDVKFKPYKLPVPKIKEDSVKPDGTMGDVAVYEKKLSVDIPFQYLNNSAKEIKILASYQGCADQGICYPPQKSQISIPLLMNLSSSGQNIKESLPSSSKETIFINEQEVLLKDLKTANLGFGVLLSLGFGLLVAFTACMYPMIPILSSLIMGQGQKLTALNSFNLSLAYTQGVAITFGLIGGGMALFGGSINIQSALQTPLVLIPTVILFVILAFSMFGFYEIQIPSKFQSFLNKYSNKQKGGSLVGVFLMGVLSALIVGPCGGPILLAVLAFATESQNVITGFIFLWVFGFGMGLPLLILGAGGGAMLPKSGLWMEKVKVTGGILMLALAIIFLERLSPTYIPEMVIMILLGILLIASGIYYGALKSLPENHSGWTMVLKSFGVVLLIYGSLFLVGVAAGGKDTLNPLSGIITKTNNSNEGIKNSFVKIYNIEELNRELAVAKAQSKPVMLDFYADWCTYCKTMEKEIFPNLKVISALKDFYLLQADITRQDEGNIALSKYLNMPAPPAIYFWNSNGINRKKLRILGEPTVDELVARANAVNLETNSN